MSKWSFFEWVAYAGMFIAALIIAADQGVKLSPDLLQQFSGVVHSPYWALAPLVLIVLATATLISREFGWIGKSVPSIKAAQFPDWPEPYSPITVIGKKFINEMVKLDGYSYNKCTFQNVTLVYNGTTAIQFANNVVQGVRFHSDNKAVLGTFAMLYAFGMLRKEFTVESSGGGVLEPAKWDNIKNEESLNT